MKPLCILLEGVGDKDAVRLARVLRLLARHVVRPDAHESTIRAMRRHKDAQPDSGSGIQWTEGRFQAHVYSWATPLELEILVETPGRKPVRLRHPMPKDLRALRDRTRLATHLDRVADLVEAGARIDDPRASRLVARLDALSEAAAAAASMLPHGTSPQTTRVSAPSPFRSPAPGFSWNGGETLTTTSAYSRLLSSRLPHMVQVRRNGTRDLFFVMEPIGSHVSAAPTSMAETMRKVTPFGGNPPDMVEWA